LIEITLKPKFGEGETKVNIKTTLKSSVAVAALFAVAAPVANAADDTLKSGTKNSLTISGQVVRAIYHADDGVSDKTF
jgi:predicted regulator of Ras-like GTPase activity (Roadblock/LC7/MglB family)